MDLEVNDGTISFQVTTLILPLWTLINLSILRFPTLQLQPISFVQNRDPLSLIREPAA